MSKLRDRRKARAFAFLHLRQIASPLEIGTAAVNGEARAGSLHPAYREDIGLKIGTMWVRQGRARATPDNRFMLVRKGRAPPGVAPDEALKQKTRIFR